MDMLRKLAVVIFISALVLPSALVWMPLTGDHIKIGDYQLSAPNIYFTINSNKLSVL